jgi:hypothetical protein
MYIGRNTWKLNHKLNCRPPGPLSKSDLHMYIGMKLPTFVPEWGIGGKHKYVHMLDTSET